MPNEHSRESEWEKEFDDKFTTPDQINGYHLTESVNGYEIKDFIRKTRQEAYARGRQDNIEHCSEPSCPECDKAAYARGRRDERDDWLQGNRCSNCGDSNLNSRGLSDICAKCCEES